LTTGAPPHYDGWLLNGGYSDMKKLGLSLAALLATAAFGWAQATATQAPAEKPAETKAAPEAKAAPKTTTHKVEAEVVSADVEKKTLTVKTADGEKTAPVGPLAMYRLKKVKAGDKVTLTCKDNEKGEHLEISFIRMATPEAKPAAASPAPEKK
jgi:hypothetical protein